jgi:transposase, IS30 family
LNPPNNSTKDFSFTALNRQMSYKHLTVEERNTISTLLRNGCNFNEIAEVIGRHRSTIKRELDKYTYCDGIYYPSLADSMAGIHKSIGPKSKKLTNEVKDIIAGLIRQKFSPKQVASYLNQHKDIKLHFSTIYRFIHESRYQDGYRDLYKHLKYQNKLDKLFSK